MFRTGLVALLAAWLSVAGTAAAAPVTVDWNVVPPGVGELPETPFYSCNGGIPTARLCQYLWEGGLEMAGTPFSFYDDKWVDGFGLDALESEIPGGGLALEIRPRCELGLAPCFDQFTPTQLQLTGHTDRIAPNLFVLSSRGGLITLPSVTGLEVLNLVGPLWEDISWIQFGFYQPEACASNDPPNDGSCEAHEQALTVESLTFDAVPLAVPEPAAAVMAAAALCAVLRRRARREPRA